MNSVAIPFQQNSWQITRSEYRHLHLRFITARYGVWTLSDLIANLRLQFGKYFASFVNPPLWKFDGKIQMKIESA